MTDLEKLVAIKDIERLKARYFRSVDTKDWAGLRAVFADDAQFDRELGVGDVANPEEFVDAVRLGLDGCISVHHGHCPEIEFLSDTSANGIWAMEDVLRWSADSPYPDQTLHGYGHYSETYEKIDGRWLIKTLSLNRLRVDIGKVN